MRNGTRSGLQRFLCRDCGRQFNERSGTLFADMKYTPQEVVFALRLRFTYRLSSREASDLMAEMGHPISRNTVLFWTGRFHDGFHELERWYRPEYSRTWHIDELHVRLRWEGLRLRRGGRPEEHHSHRADGEEGQGRHGQGAEEGEGRGGLRTGHPHLRRGPGLSAGHAEVMPGTRHVVAQFKGTLVSHRGRLVTVSNNLLERLNGARVADEVTKPEK